MDLSDPCAHPPRGHLPVFDGNGEAYPPQEAPQDYGLQNWEYVGEFPYGRDDLDFESQAPFGPDPDALDFSLSLGTILSKPALPATRPLPPTFRDAELEALAPSKPVVTGNSSISTYFAEGVNENNFHSVRETDQWEQVKDDVVFKEFLEVPNKFINRFELAASRARPDPNWTAPDLKLVGSHRAGPKATADRTQRLNSTILVSNIASDSKASPDRNAAVTLSLDDHTIGITKAGDADTNKMDYDDDDASVEMDLESNASRSPERATSPPNHLDNLEKALYSIEGNEAQNTNTVGPLAGPTFPPPASQRRSQSRQQSPFRALPPIKDESQEKLLAALGVEGSPKMIYEVPGPALAPVPEIAFKPQDRGRNAYGTTHGGRPQANGRNSYGPDPGFMPQDYGRSAYGPNHAPPPPPSWQQPSHFHGSHARLASNGFAAGPKPPPPPPALQDPRFRESFADSGDSRHNGRMFQGHNPLAGNAGNGGPLSPASERRNSSGSQHTQAGSDFYDDDDNSPAWGDQGQHGKRKRPREDQQQGQVDKRGKLRQAEDTSKGGRKKEGPKVPDALK